MGGASSAAANDGGAVGGVSGESGSSGTGGGVDGPDDVCADGVISDDGSRLLPRVEQRRDMPRCARRLRRPRRALVKVETAGEDEILAGNPWLGASDTAFENVFVWTDGRPLPFGNRGPNQPDRFPGQECVEKRNTVGRPWFDQPCDNERLRASARALSGG